MQTFLSLVLDEGKIFFLDALKNNRTSKKKHLKFNTKQKKMSKVTKILDGSLKNNLLQM